MALLDSQRSSPSTAPFIIGAGTRQQGVIADSRTLAEESEIEFASTSSTAVACPLAHSSAVSIRSRKSIYNYNNDGYVLDHLNDPNYTYRASIEDVKQATAGIWPQPSDSNRHSYLMREKSRTDAGKEGLGDDRQATTSPYEEEPYE
jgi:hypothetical protein